MTLPKDSKDRKAYPLYKGLWQYFPAALAAVANVSHVGNEQHNPGQMCFDNREKSNDDYDCMLRHLSEADQLDDDGLLHAAKVAWRALRACQKILEQRGAPEAPAAQYPKLEEADWMHVHPSLERIPNMEHRDYYKFDPHEVVRGCSHLGCSRSIKASDTPIVHGNRMFCSYVCAKQANP